MNSLGREGRNSVMMLKREKTTRQRKQHEGPAFPPKGGRPPDLKPVASLRNRYTWGERRGRKRKKFEESGLEKSRVIVPCKKVHTRRQGGWNQRERGT